MKTPEEMILVKDHRKVKIYHLTSDTTLWAIYYEYDMGQPWVKVPISRSMEYMNERQVKRLINKLLKEGYVEVPRFTLKGQIMPKEQVSLGRYL